MKVTRKILPFHNFLVNALRAGLIRPALENVFFMTNLPVPLNFFEPLTLAFFG